MENYRRNTGHVHPLKTSDSKKQKSVSKRDGSSVQLKDVGHELLWSGEVSFGGQNISLDFDTGSADTLVNPSAYNPSRSQTSKNTNQPFRTAYGDGTKAEGTIYTDKFSIAGFQAENVSIGVSVQEFMGQNQQPSQGIGGLSFPSLQAFPKDFPPFFESLRQQKAMSRGVFQFTLKPDSGSELHIGGIDQSKAKGDFSYAKVDASQGFWVTPASINGKSITAIVDSGSTIITGPLNEVRSVVHTMEGLMPVDQQGATAFLFDCEKTPEVTISIAGLDVKLNKAQTHFGQTQGRCMLPIVGQDGMPMNAWIIGDTLFQATTIVFDVDQTQIGFALQA